MSVLYYLICPETKKYVWIGRNTKTRHESGASVEITIYSDEPTAPFLYEHLGKEIICVNEFYFENCPSTYTEVHWSDYIKG